MSYQFFANMQRRGDKAVYADLHKTDERIYFDSESAQAAIDKNPDIAPHRHVVSMVAMTSDEYDRDNAERARLIAMIREALPHCPDIMRTQFESELSTLGAA